MHVSERDLEAFLLDAGLVARAELERAQNEAQEEARTLGDVLVARGALSEDSLRRVHSYILGIPFVNLLHERPALDVLSLIPEPIARTHNIVAYRKEGNTLEVALLDLASLAAAESARSTGGLRLLPRLTDLESMTHALLHYQRALKDAFGDVIVAEAAKLAPPPPDAAPMSAADLKKAAEDLPVVRIVDTLLRHAVLQGASDIHIEPLEQETLVRYRIDGTLRDAMVLPKASATGIAARIKLLAGLAVGEQRTPQDGRFLMETETDRVTLRVSTLPVSSGEKIVLRVLRETGEGFTLEALGFHGEGLERLHRALRQKSGLILVAGPHGSGKTTTLYTMMDILHRPGVSIATIEDPVEYRLARVMQTQAAPEAGLSLAEGVRALLRQDADVITIGDIPDEETAALAVSAALSGRLVLAAVAAENASGALRRLLELGVEAHSFAAVLRVAVGQRLARRLCNQKESYNASAAERPRTAGEAAFAAALRALAEERLANAGTSADALRFFRPVASPECADGYQSHVGLQEVLSASSAIRNLLREDASAAEIAAQAQREGMLNLLEDGIYKAARGVTSLEEVSRVIS